MYTTKKILVVDDDIDILTAVEAILKSKGYQVVTATNKVEGFEMIEGEKPDLAILDVMMTTPYEGFEMAKSLVENPAMKDMPVIIQTSIEVLETTQPYVQEMARQFRQDPAFSDLRVILLKDVVSGSAGVDYLNEEGRNIWFPVNAFVKKPVSMDTLLPEVERLLIGVTAN
jgi:CheY-like chemotaxis protein